MTFPLVINLTINEIPAKAKVNHFKKHKGNLSLRAVDPDEFFGWIELDYRLLDRKGYYAPWLDALAYEKGILDEIEADVIEQVEETLEEMKQDRQIQKRKEQIS